MALQSLLRRLFIRTILRARWQRSDEVLARVIHRFSLVEADSAWQFLRTIEHAPNAKYAAELFNNALEEVQHASIFRRLATRYASLPSVPVAEARQQLFDPAKGLEVFMAYHHVAEGEVYAQFGDYAAAAGRPEVRNTFEAIRADEAGHQELAHRQLEDRVGSSRIANRLIRRVHWQRGWQAWERIGKGMGEITASVVMSAIYLVAGILFGVLCRRRLALADREIYSVVFKGPSSAVETDRTQAPKTFERVATVPQA